AAGLSAATGTAATTRLAQSTRRAAADRTTITLRFAGAARDAAGTAGTPEQVRCARTAAPARRPGSARRTASGTAGRAEAACARATTRQAAAKGIAVAESTCVPRTRCATISAFTRVFDALWWCAAKPGPII